MFEPLPCGIIGGGHEVVFVLVVQDRHHQVESVVHGDEVVAEADGTDIGIDRVGIHGGLVPDHLLPPEGVPAVEKAVRKDVQVSFRRSVPTVDEVAVGHA